jgi:hypothetical protein
MYQEVFFQAIQIILILFLVEIPTTHSLLLIEIYMGTR